MRGALHPPVRARQDRPPISTSGRQNPHLPRARLTSGLGFSRETCPKAPARFYLAREAESDGDRGHSGGHAQRSTPEGGEKREAAATGADQRDDRHTQRRTEDGGQRRDGGGRKRSGNAAARAGLLQRAPPPKHRGPRPGRTTTDRKPKRESQGLSPETASLSSSPAQLLETVVYTAWRNHSRKRKTQRQEEARAGSTRPRKHPGG